MKVLAVLDTADNMIHDKGAEVLVSGIIGKVRDTNILFPLEPNFNVDVQVSSQSTIQ